MPFCIQKFFQEIHVPPGHLPLHRQASRAGIVLQLGQGNLAEEGEIARSIPFLALAVFIKSNIQLPVQVVLDTPVRPYSVHNTFGVQRQGGDVVAFLRILMI